MSPRMQLSPHQFAMYRILAGLFAVAWGAAMCVPAPDPGALLAAGGGALAGALVMVGVVRRLSSLAVIAAMLFVGTPTLQGGGALNAWPETAAAGLSTFPLILIVLAPGGEPWRLAGQTNPAWSLRHERWLIALAWAGTAALIILCFFAAAYLASLIPAAVLLFLFAFRWPGPGRPATHPGQAPVVFFDGFCGLCNTAVDWIIVEDRGRIFRYAPIQGEFAQRTLAADLVEDMNTMLYLDEHGLHERSDAVLAIGLRLGGLWKSARIALLLPRSWRNGLYDLIAANRYRWFGKKESCRLPTPEERSLFLM